MYWTLKAESWWHTSMKWMLPADMVLLYKYIVKGLHQCVQFTRHSHFGTESSPAQSVLAIMHPSLVTSEILSSYTYTNVCVHYVKICHLKCARKLETTKFQHIKSPCSASFGHDAPITWYMWDIVLVYTFLKFEVITCKSFFLNATASPTQMPTPTPMPTHGKPT